MLLTCAVEGGDPAVTELVQSIGAETAWAKIIESVLGEPAAQRAAAVPMPRPSASPRTYRRRHRHPRRVRP
jgi:hypothetical protein